MVLIGTVDSRYVECKYINGSMVNTGSSAVQSHRDIGTLLVNCILYIIVFCEHVQHA